MDWRVCNAVQQAIGGSLKIESGVEARHERDVKSADAAGIRVAALVIHLPEWAVTR